MSLVTMPRQVSIDASGEPRVGAQWFFYAAGTDDLLPLFTTAAMDVSLSNPVISLEGGLFPAVYIDSGAFPTHKQVLFDADGLTVFTENNTPTAGFTSADVGGALYPLTATEISSAADPSYLQFSTNPLDARRYGMLDTGGSTDSTDELQATLAALNAGVTKGGALLIPGDANSIVNVSDALALPKRASGDNHSRWYSLSGMGRGAPRLTAITGMANKVMIDASGVDSSTYSFYREIKALYLNGASIAQKGIDIRYNQHFRLDNLFITGLANGSGTAAGVEMFGAICSEITGVKVHNCEGHGFYMSGGSGNFFNANSVSGCSVLDVTKSGMYFTGGCAGSDISGNTFEFCDDYGLRFGGYSAGGTHVHGNYLESNGLGDIFIGEDTSQECTTFEANYLNGYSAGVGATTYTPIKMKFANNVRIIGNQVAVATKSATGFLILDANVAGGGVSNCVVEDNAVADLATTTAPNTIYNLPGTWVDFGNRLIDPTFAPLITNNVFRGRFPYGGWSLAPTGAATTVRSATNLFGAPSLKITRPGGGDTCVVQQVFTIGPEFKNRFVTFAIPVRSNASSKQIDVSISPDGTSPQTATISDSSLASGSQRIIYAMGFAPSDATTVTCTVSLASAGADFDVGHPCLYVGAQQWYSADGEQDWRANAAPADGTWADGDKVWLLNAVSGAKAGFTCTVAGAPGTWVNMANLA